MLPLSPRNWIIATIRIGVSVLAVVSVTSLAAAPTDLDPTFNGSGIAIFDTAVNSAERSDHAAALVADRQGRLVVASWCERVAGSLQRNVCLSRLSESGVRDLSFGIGGVAVSAFRHFLFSPASSVPIGIALQSDERIVIATACVSDAVPEQRCCVQRYTSNGVLDGSFGTAGTVVFDAGGVASPSLFAAIRIDWRDRIHLAGTCVNGARTRTDICIARLNANGSVDTWFGVGGATVVNLAIGSASNQSIGAMSLDWDGRIIAAGRCDLAITSTDFCVTRFSESGVWDTNFAGVGYASIAFTNDGSFEIARSVLVQADGGILVGGDCLTPPRSVCIARLNAAGALDASFDAAYGRSGKSRITFEDQHTSLVSMLQLPGGRVVVIASCTGVAAKGSSFCIARLQAQGYLDTSFSVDGRGWVYLPAQQAHAALVDRRGRLVIAGECESSSAAQWDSCVVRIEGGPHSARTCSLDIDGDGTTSYTDALIWSRLMFGSDSRVLSGLTLAPEALRRDATAVQGFTARQCNFPTR